MATVTPRPQVVTATGVAPAGVLLVGWLGGRATAIGPRYRALKQPPWKPPVPWFGSARGVIMVRPNAPF